MADVLLEYDGSLSGPADRTYLARACGRVMDDGHRWEGWIEFVPADGGTVLRTPRETVQPNRTDTVYWATGLTAAYLEGALKRALGPTRRAPVGDEPRKSTYESPAPNVPYAEGEPAPRLRGSAVLDPFHVFEQGEEILRQELNALEPQHLRNIIRAYHLAPPEGLDAQDSSRGELSEMIVVAVRKRATGERNEQAG